MEPIKIKVRETHWASKEGNFIENIEITINEKGIFIKDKLVLDMTYNASLGLCLNLGRRDGIDCNHYCIFGPKSRRLYKKLKPFYKE